MTVPTLPMSRREAWMRGVAPGGTWIDQAGLAAVLLLPPMLMHSRATADVLISLIDVLFLVRCAREGAWDWTRQGWVRVAGAFWLWMVLCSLLAGGARPLGQALVTIRLFLLVAALQDWLMRPPDARRWLNAAFIACAAWVALEAWHQMLLGRNFLGYHRAGDGVLTGPFGKERAGPIYVDVFFPAVLPFVIDRMGRPGVRPRLIGLAVLLAATATQVLIGQRMPTLLVLFGLLVAAVLTPRLRWAAAGVLALCLVLVALLPVVSPPTFQRLVVHFVEQMQHFWADAYGQIFLRAFGMIQSNPIFGLGYDGYRLNCLDPAYLHGNALIGMPDAAIDGESGCNIHPHNYWLEVLTSFGVPGGVLLSALVLLWLRDGWGVAAARTPLHAALLTATIVLLWPFATRSSLFVVDAGGWAFLTAGWLLAAAAPARAALAAQSTARRLQAEAGSS